MQNEIAKLHSPLAGNAYNYFQDLFKQEEIPEK